MGLVYKARQLDNGREVALKTLHMHLVDDDEARQRFEREISMIQRLQSPHTVAIFDAGIDGTVPYFTMELLDGLPLQRVLGGSGALPARMAVQITLQLLQSLDEAHTLGIMHRDLTPPNVFLCRHSTQIFHVKVLDFGLAKHFNQKGRSRLTGGGVALGTLPYMAPEQLKRGTLGPTTDLYMVGHLLFEMLAGHNLYRGMDNAQIVHHKLGKLRVPIHGEPMQGPLGSVIHKALQIEQEHRYHNAAQMRQHLAVQARLLPETPIPPSLLEQARPQHTAAPGEPTRAFAPPTRQPSLEVDADTRPHPKPPVTERRRNLGQSTRPPWEPPITMEQ